jgi:uncharacterized protein YbjT (DUF2867 family)
MTERTNTSTLTLVAGGTGKTGRRVAERLRARDLAVRIGSRAADPSFDWDRRDTWEAALRGVDAAYVSYAPDLAFPGAADRVAAFTRMAVDAGVRRLVLLSGRNEDGAQRAERAVERSGVDWTIVRASMFSQNFSEGFLIESVLHGELAFPAGNVAEPFVDTDDIADIAVAALTDDRHVGQRYEVTGPRLLTFADAAAEIGEATGRDVRYVPITSEAFAAALVHEGLPFDFVTDLTALFSAILDGRNASLTDGVQRALGRAPRDFRKYAADAAASGVWSTDADRISR